MTNSLRLAMVLSLAACSPSPLGLLTLPDAATEADATPPLPRDVRFAWSATDASPVTDAGTPDAALVHDGAVADVVTVPDADVADAAAPSPDVPVVPDAADDAGAADAGTMPDAAAGDAVAPSPDVPTVPVCQGETSACNDGCRDLRNDPQNCGACGTSCRTGDECRAGQCWGWVFRGAYSIDTRPYARERELARLSAALNAECAMRVPGSRVCSGEESLAAARAACDETDFAWITRDRVDWLGSNEAATSLLICRGGMVYQPAEAIPLVPGTRRVACCVQGQTMAALDANVR
jgi:hypothetical protein